MWRVIIGLIGVGLMWGGSAWTSFAGDLNSSYSQGSISLVTPGTMDTLDLNQVKYQGTGKFIAGQTVSLGNRILEGVDTPAAQRAGTIIGFGKMAYDGHELLKNTQTRPYDPATTVRAAGFAAGVAGRVMGSSVAGAVGAAAGPLRTVGEVVRSGIITSETIDLVKVPGGRGPLKVQGITGATKGDLSFSGSGVAGTANWNLKHTPTTASRTAVVNYSYDRNLPLNTKVSGKSTVRQTIVEDYGKGFKGVVNRLIGTPQVTVNTTRSQSSRTRETVVPQGNLYTTGYKDYSRPAYNAPRATQINTPSYNNNIHNYSTVQSYNPPVTYQSYSTPSYNYNSSFNSGMNYHFNTNSSMRSFNFRIK